MVRSGRERAWEMSQRIASDLTRLAHFDRNLVRGSADAARAHFDGRLHVVERALEHVEAALFQATFDRLDGAVEDGLGNALLAVLLHAVDELGDDAVVVNRIGKQLTLTGRTFSRHTGTELLGALRAVLGTALATVRYAY
jgi:hypothetical protein